MSIRRVADRARHHLRRPITRTPYVWDLAMLARPDKHATLARRDTAIVIEGYERSGNTFSVAAFTIANGDAQHVGRHLHGAGHILRAVRLRLPTVVLIRPPRDAVLSYLVRRGTLEPHVAALAYLDFYQTVWPVRDGFVIGLFDQVVTDFGAVLEQVNGRFGTIFARYEPTPDNESAVFGLVEEMNRQECRGQVLETHVGRPSDERSRHKREFESLLDRPRTAAVLRRADSLYERYARLAGDRALPSPVQAPAPHHDHAGRERTDAERPGPGEPDRRRAVGRNEDRHQ